MSIRAWRTTLAFIAIAALAGCAQSSGSGSGGGGGGFDASNLKDSTAGSFLTEASAPMDGWSTPEGFELPETAECAALPEDQKWDYGFDSRAQVGDTFVETLATATTEMSGSMTQTTTIASKSADTLITNTTTSNIAINPSPGFPVPSTVSSKTTCVTKPDGSYPECSVEMTTPPPSGNFPDSLSCTSTFDSDAKVTGLAEKGVFTLQSGAKVQAIRITQTSTVKITCKRGDGPEEDYGTGMTQITTIKTRDVVSRHPTSCQSEPTLYMFMQTAQDGGKVLSTFKTETLSAPVR